MTHAKVLGGIANSLEIQQEWENNVALASWTMFLPHSELFV
jgi:hypothetical protein